MTRLGRARHRRCAAVVMCALLSTVVAACEGAPVSSVGMITGKWTGEMYDRTAGVPLSASLVEHRGGSVPTMARPADAAVPKWPGSRIA